MDDQLLFTEEFIGPASNKAEMFNYGTQTNIYFGDNVQGYVIVHVLRDEQTIVRISDGVSTEHSLQDFVVPGSNRSRR
jgi:hypothetical protein